MTCARATHRCSTVGVTGSWAGDDVPEPALTGSDVRAYPPATMPAAPSTAMVRRRPAGSGARCRPGLVMNRAAQPGQKPALVSSEAKPACRAHSGSSFLAGCCSGAGSESGVAVVSAAAASHCCSAYAARMASVASFRAAHPDSLIPAGYFAASFCRSR